MNERSRQQRDLRANAAATAGFWLIASGCAGYDWRVALIVAGSILLVSGTLSLLRGGP